jgi:hypothetical protein
MASRRRGPCVRGHPRPSRPRPLFRRSARHPGPSTRCRSAYLWAMAVTRIEVVLSRVFCMGRGSAERRSGAADQRLRRARIWMLGRGEANLAMRLPADRVPAHDDGRRVRLLTSARRGLAPTGVLEVRRGERGEVVTCRPMCGHQAAITSGLRVVTAVRSNRAVRVRRSQRPPAVGPCSALRTVSIVSEVCRRRGRRGRYRPSWCGPGSPRRVA